MLLTRIKKKKKGEWSEESAGGRISAGAWRKNPQYLLSTLDDSQLFICLSTKEEQNLGFYITRANDRKRKIYTLDDESIIKKAPFRKSSETYCTFKTEANQSYHIIPCTFAPGVVCEFTLTIYAINNAAITLIHIEPDKHQTITVLSIIIDYDEIMI